MIFDIEADGLLDEATRLHVMAYKVGEEVHYTHDYDEMREILLSAKQLIGHNIICYDVPLLERILGIKIKAKLVDTLALSWYLMPNRVRHGLEYYGEDHGVPKPKVDDWKNLSPEEYAHRCVEDVKINSLVWRDQREKLLELYDDDKKEARRLISYLSFKMDCLREQEKSKVLLDLPRIERNIEELTKEMDDITKQLLAVMPKVPVYSVRTRPAKPFKMDGSYSVHGAKWFSLLKSEGLPEDYDGEVKVLVKEDEPNPSSNPQVKDWLFSLGWKPCSFKFSFDQFGKEKKIPQVRVEGDDGKELAPSVLRLIESNPSVELLSRITTVAHRLATFKGFLRDQENGLIVAGAAGFTNTLRFKHRTLVNLPGVDKPYGKEIRGSLIARDGYEYCGSDMCSLESTTKRHYMFPYDPEYVHEMSKPGFDEHLDLAKIANEVTQHDIDLYNEGKGDFARVKASRKKFKPANYAGVYGVGKVTLARQTGMSEKECRRLLDIYWERNWSVKKVAQNTLFKYVGTEMWLYNPVSRFWYSLRAEKDIFSTLNQGTGVFCFDSWLQEIRKVRPQLTAQFHDEGIWEIKKGHREEMTALLKDSIARVNDKLKLNVPLDVDVQFGQNYAEIH